MAFYENYVQLCNEVGKSPSAVAIELKLGKPSVSRWKTGTKPRDTTVLKVANYFGVTVEELMSDTPSAGIKKERPADGEALIRDLPEDIQQIIRICMNRPELASALLNLAKQIEKD
nr:MAG: helix-turn-helix domain protein [Bacteriophage sp.]UWD62979.1 MAG: helix-turn-helix domain protein [Bacteriophage sp.]